VHTFLVMLQLQAQLNAGLCHLQHENYFNCQNCSQIGYGPFELNKTSGFQLIVRHTKSGYGESCHIILCKAAYNGCSVQHAPHQLYSFGRVTLPCAALPSEMYCRHPFGQASSAVQIWCKPIYTCLVDMQALFRQFHLKPHCQTYRSNLAMILLSHPSATLGSIHMPRHSAMNGTYLLYMATICKSILPEITALVCSHEDICFSTTRLACQLLLPNVTSIGFSSNTDNVSFCLEDFHMLPSQVASAGEPCHICCSFVSPTYRASPL